MLNRSNAIVGITLPCLLTMGLMCGCAYDTRAPSQVEAVSSVESTHEQFRETRDQVKEMLDATEAMNSPRADLQQRFRTFRAELDDTRGAAKRAAEQSADMRARTDIYINSWKSEARMVSDEQLRSAAEERAQNVQQRFESISQQARQIRDEFQPFLNGLTDLEAYLMHDLTPAGVRAASGTFEEALSEGQELRRMLDQAIQDLGALAGDLTPATGQKSNGSGSRTDTRN